MRFSSNTPRRGFTLVELLVVITIIGIIGTVVTVNVIQHIDTAKRTKTIEMIVSLKGACDIFRMHKGRYPKDIEELTQPSKKNSDEAYLRVVPKDPFGSEFIYNAEGRKIEIESSGPDKQEGSEDDITLEKIESGEYTSDDEDG